MDSYIETDREAWVEERLESKRGKEDWTPLVDAARHNKLFPNTKKEVGEILRSMNNIEIETIDNKRMVLLK